MSSWQSVCHRHPAWPQGDKETTGRMCCLFRWCAAASAATSRVSAVCSADERGVAAWRLFVQRGAVHHEIESPQVPVWVAASACCGRTRPSGLTASFATRARATLRAERVEQTAAA